MSIGASPKARNDCVRPAECFLVGEALGAAMLGVSKPTFRRWVKEGLIVPVKLPHDIRRRLYRREDLETFAAELASGGASQAV